MAKELDEFEVIRERWQPVQGAWGNTPPPWEAKQFTPFGPRRWVVSKPTGRVVLEVQGGPEAQEALTHSPQDVAWLIAEVDRLRRLVPTEKFVAAVDYAATVMRHELGNRYSDTRDQLAEFASRFREASLEGAE